MRCVNKHNVSQKSKSTLTNRGMTSKTTVENFRNWYAFVCYFIHMISFYRPHAYGCAYMNLLVPICSVLTTKYVVAIRFLPHLFKHGQAALAGNTRLSSDRSPFVTITDSMFWQSPKICCFISHCGKFVLTNSTGCDELTVQMRSKFLFSVTAQQTGYENYQVNLIVEFLIITCNVVLMRRMFYLLFCSKSFGRDKFKCVNFTVLCSVEVPAFILLS